MTNIQKIDSDICARPPKKWFSIPQTMYSFFIMISLSWSKKKDVTKSKICKSVMIAGPSLFFSIIAEAIIVLELGGYIELMEAEKYINSTNISFITDEPKNNLFMIQFICISLFLIDMSSKFFATLKNIISIFSREVKYDDKIYSIKVPKCSKVIILFCMLPDITTWLAVTIIGIKFLLISSSTTDIIIDTLAINYIVDVDDMVFNSFVPEKIKDSLETIEFSSFISYKTSKISSYYNLYIHLPLIIISTALIVYFNSDIEINTKEYVVFSSFCLCFLSIVCSIIINRKKGKIFPLNKYI